ncbi:MAG: VOC family protein [Proteobacteria bacterium]|nr:VOC family protein [Pseudomonadota bacterium]
MILFKDLFNADDFSIAVNDIARGFREKFDLPKIGQLGLVVPDVEKAAENLEATGIPSVFIAKGSPVLWKERGENRNFRGKLGISYYQGFQIEPLEPGEGSDFYCQSADPCGDIVVQHLGFFVSDVDAWAAKLNSAGYETWVRGQIKFGPSKTDFAYMDTIHDAGIIIEFISEKFWEIRFKTPAMFYRILGRFEKLIGKRCIDVTN